MPVCDVCRGAHVEGVAKLGHARFCNLCGGARFGSRAKPSLDIPVCDFCPCGAFFGSRARPMLYMRVCDFGCVAYFGSRAAPSVDMPVSDFCRYAHIWAS